MTQKTPKERKSSEISNIYCFPAIFVMLKRSLTTFLAIKKEIHCAGGFFEEVNAVFHLKKPRIKTEIGKKVKHFQFFTF